MSGSSGVNKPRLLAQLPSGQLLIAGPATTPGEHLTCAGPNRWGQCPAAARGERPACEGAAWFRSDGPGRVWHFSFPGTRAACPAALLDPVRTS